MAKKSNYTQEWQDNAALSDYETELALKQERKLIFLQVKQLFRLQ